jgi:phytoene dehydrogenase-like protein
MVDVCVIGAGPSGLSCARLLRANGLDTLVVEAEDEIGGRLRTDQVQRFLLDRGFQVLQTDYPEAKRQLDYHSLDLHPFQSGALIRHNNRWIRFADPFRDPRHALGGVFSQVGGLKDKMRLWAFRRRVLRSTVQDLFQEPERPMSEALIREGFSERIIERFFRPFFTAVFFDPELQTTSRMFEFVFRVFASGDAALPGKGIMAVPRQLARSFPAGMTILNAPVSHIKPGKIALKSGQEIQAKTVVVACDGVEAARLLDMHNEHAYRSVRCIYFQAPEPPLREPLLVLGSKGNGPITSMCVPSQVAPGYAPEGLSLISVTVVGQTAVADHELLRAVLRQAQEWFGAQVQAWEHLKSYTIPRALPVQRPPTPNPFRRRIRMGPGVYLAGDLGALSSLQWALHSGRRAAETVIQDFGLSFQGSNLTEGVLDSGKTS